MKRALFSFCLLGNLPVLAEGAPEVTSERGHRKREGAREEIKEGFFFDWVYVRGNHFTIDMGVKFSLRILSNPTNPELKRGNQAPVMAEKACRFLVLFLPEKHRFFDHNPQASL